MRIAFLLSYGPEVRAFYYSGLAATVERLGHHTVALLLAPVEMPINSVAPLVRVAPEPLPRVVKRLSRVCDGSHEAWLERRSGSSRWRLIPPANARRSAWRRAARAVTGMSALRMMLCRAEKLAMNRAGSRGLVARSLSALNVDAVVASSYSSERALPLLNAAGSMGIASISLTNSWKDIHVRRRLKTAPDLVGVWNASLKQDLLQFNPGYPTGRVFVTGSLHLAALMATKDYPDRTEFCRQVGLDPSSPIVCYSAASPSAIPREEALVEQVTRILRDWPKMAKPQLVIRSNPMGGAERFEKIVRAEDGVALSLPAWQWERNHDWCCPLPEDLSIWRAIIEHSAVNVSAASTVTLEFALFGKPVLNLCFGAGGDAAQEAALRRLWSAPFYRSVREDSLATAALSPEELNAGIEAGLGTGGAPAPLGSDETLRVASVSEVADLIVDAVQEAQKFRRT